MKYVTISLFTVINIIVIFMIYFIVSGVTHHDDLQYLFFMKFKFPYFEKDVPEIPTVELMTSMWSNFAQTGQPVPPILANITWKPYDLAKDDYLDISEEPKMKTGFYSDRMQEWERLFPIPPIQ